MKSRFRLLMLLGTALLIVSAACSAIPKGVRQTAVDVPFDELVQHTDRYVSRTVILGGYIERIRVTDAATRFVVLQAPLGMFDQPKSKKASEGRFLVVYEGVLGAEDYGVGQDVTIVGTVAGSRVPEIGYYADRMPAVDALSIYRWHYGFEDDYCDSPVNGEAFPAYEKSPR